jgi:hypothetical protein
VRFLMIANCNPEPVSLHQRKLSVALTIMPQGPWNDGRDVELVKSAIRDLPST